MWWENLSSLQQVSFIVAATATLIMILFIVLMLMGMDGAESFDGDVGFDMDVDINADVDIHIDDIQNVDVYNSDAISSISGLRIVSIRGGLAFLSIGGWVVYLLSESIQVWLAILFGILAGALAATLLALAMKATMKLESSGNLDYHGAIGKNAVVYIRIPKAGMGKGKVMLNHQGKFMEIDAMTKKNEEIIAKKEVKIIGLENETTLIVEKI